MSSMLEKLQKNGIGGIPILNILVMLPLLKLMMYTFPNFLCKLLAQAIIKNFGFQQKN